MSQTERFGKSYIGKVEAYELMLERGLETLPRKGKEWVTVYSTFENALGKPNVVLGKDENGFYTAELA